MIFPLKPTKTSDFKLVSVHVTYSLFFFPKHRSSCHENVCCIWRPEGPAKTKKHCTSPSAGGIVAGIWPWRGNKTYDFAFFFNEEINKEHVSWWNDFIILLYSVHGWNGRQPRLTYSPTIHPRMPGLSMRKHLTDYYITSDSFSSWTYCTSHVPRLSTSLPSGI